MNEERKRELSRSRDWRAVFKIFERFGEDERLWRHVNLETKSIDFPAMLEGGTFSGGERRLLKVAAYLFSQDYEVNLWSVLAGLDKENSAAVVEAVREFTRG